MTDAHWLIKDFHALYRAAHRFSEACHGRGNEGPYAPQKDLDAQLARLKPAFEVCDAERKGGSEAAIRVLRGAGYPKTAAVVELQRLTEAERKALNALHRWLHSPAGDYMLTEEAQDFHEQVERECPSDCTRLEEEERMAWGQRQRGEVEP